MAGAPGTATNRSPSNKSPSKGEKRRAPVPASPSSSIVLLSPSNQILLLHRVRSSSAFASAHVFPGGNLSPFHDGPTPDPDSPARHRDGPAYRLAAVRETFEESGILLARRAGDKEPIESPLLDLPADVRDAGRKAVHGNSARFVDWLRERGGIADVDGLIPFTRWITPTSRPKRFSTQMYLYMLPLPAAVSSSFSLPPAESVGSPTPTHDGGLEHTAAAFDNASSWLARARTNDIILFPPQSYLLSILARFLTGSPAATSSGSAREHYQAQRDALLAFAADPYPGGSGHPTGTISWADKVMGTAQLFVSRDGRSVLGLEKPGRELQGTGRGGDWDRVILARFTAGGIRDVEVRWRKEVMAEEGRPEAKI